MSGYSYFNYDQMTLLDVEVHSDELELLKNAADAYDFGAIKSEVEPLFKEAAIDFRNGKHSSVCPRKSKIKRRTHETNRRTSILSFRS